MQCDMSPSRTMGIKIRGKLVLGRELLASFPFHQKKWEKAFDLESGDHCSGPGLTNDELCDLGQDI